MVYVKVNNELYHHGILGQKWGTRNGPPYPLHANAHSSSERKAGWRKSLDGGSEKKEDERKRSKSSASDNVKDIAKKAIKKKKPVDEARTDIAKKPKAVEVDAPVENTEKQPRKPLTEEQKRTIRNVAIGTAAAVGVGAAVYFGYKYHAMKKLSEASGEGDIGREAAKKVMLESLDDYTKVLKEGSTLHAVAAKAPSDLKNVSLSFDKKDITKQMVDLTNNGTDISFKATKDIKLPTQAKAKQLFEELWEEDPEYRSQLSDLVYEKLYKNNPTADTKIVRASSNLNLRSDPFREAIYALNESDTASDKLKTKLKSGGYDAVENFYDVRGGFANNSITFLDPNGSLSKSGEQFITNKYAGKAVRELLASNFKEKMTEGHNKRYRALLQKLLAVA